MGRGSLFWLLVSVVLSVTLTVLANLVLFVLYGLTAGLTGRRGYLP